MTALPSYEEEEIEIEENETKRKQVIDYLKQNELIDYGKTVTELEQEKALKVEKRSCTIEEWTFLCLQLRGIIQGEGFFVTSRGRKENLYILDRHEMASSNESKGRAEYRRIRLRQRALNMVDPNYLEKEQQKKLEFEILKNGSHIIEMSKSINTRCRY